MIVCVQVGIALSQNVFIRIDCKDSAFVTCTPDCENFTPKCDEGIYFVCVVNYLRCCDTELRAILSNSK